MRRLRDLQDNLGEHQDAEVHAAELRRIAHDMLDLDAPTATMVALRDLATRLDQRQSAARHEFARRFADYDSEATERALHRMLEGVAS